MYKETNSVKELNPKELFESLQAVADGVLDDISKQQKPMDPEVVLNRSAFDTIFKLSIADSLKRIADSLEQQQK